MEDWLPNLVYPWYIKCMLGQESLNPDYTGEVKVLLINAALCYHYIKRGDLIAQLILEKISLPILRKVDELPPTQRGEHGCGS